MGSGMGLSRPHIMMSPPDGFITQSDVVEGHIGTTAIHPDFAGLTAVDANAHVFVRRQVRFRVTRVRRTKMLGALPRGAAGE